MTPPIPRYDVSTLGHYPISTTVEWNKLIPMQYLNCTGRNSSTKRDETLTGSCHQVPRSSCGLQSSDFLSIDREIGLCRSRREFQGPNTLRMM
jgi:hypothetical protein